MVFVWEKNVACNEMEITLPVITEKYWNIYYHYTFTSMKTMYLKTQQMLSSPIDHLVAEERTNFFKFFYNFTFIQQQLSVVSMPN